MKKCLECENEHKNDKFCSIDCTQLYLKKNKIGAYYNPKLRKNICAKGGRRTHQKHPELRSMVMKKFWKLNPHHNDKIIAINKKNKKGIFDLEVRKMGGRARGLQLKKESKSYFLRLSKAGVDARKKRKIHIYGSSFHKRMKKEKKGFFNPEVQKEGGRISFLKHPEMFTENGLKAIRTIRENRRNLFFEGNCYDSHPEIEISLCLKYQLGYTPQKNKTLHIRLGRFEYDYLFNNIFIEYHPFNWNKMTHETYYRRRRKNLDVNGYKHCSLIVIK